MVCSNQPTGDGRSPQAGRATLASHQAPAGLGHAEGIPNAGARNWTLWSECRCPNERGAYRFRASFELLGLPVTAEWTEALHLCGMGFEESEWWPLTSCHWDGSRRYITNKTLQWSPIEESDPDGIVWEGLNLLPCPFTGVKPSIRVTGQFIGAPLWRSEAIYISSPAIPQRRWTSAAKMVEAWNTRAPAQRIEARSDETLQAARPEGQEPDGEADAPNP